MLWKLSWHHYQYDYNFAPPLLQAPRKCASDIDAPLLLLSILCAYQHMMFGAMMCQWQDPCSPVSRSCFSSIQGVGVMTCSHIERKTRITWYQCSISIAPRCPETCFRTLGRNDMNSEKRQVRWMNGLGHDKPAWRSNQFCFCNNELFPSKFYQWFCIFSCCYLTFW